MRQKFLRNADDIYVEVSASGLLIPLPRTTILDLDSKELTPPRPLAVRLTEVFFAVEKGLTILLWWDEGEDKASLILPIVEGQGRLDFNSFGGLHNPKNEGFTGHVQLSTKQAKGVEMNFTLVLGFAKLRS